MRTRAALTFLAACAVGAAATPATAQPGAALTISRIASNGPLRVGENTFRVTVRNGSTQSPTPQGEAVLVTLTVRGPDGSARDYEGSIRGGIGSNGSQTAAIAGVKLARPGAYTVSAVAFLAEKAGRAPNRSPVRSEVFDVGGAAGDGAYQLLVLARNRRNAPAHGVRVALRSSDGGEIDWKRTGGTGEARFPRVAPSPKDAPYTIEVKAGAQVVGTFPFVMPAQNAVYEAKTDLP